MKRDGKTVEVLERPPCDICTGRAGTHDVTPAREAEPVREAIYDAKTRGGGWAYLCEADFRLYGVGLGVGSGQRLLVQAASGKE
jgi:hypothetical protein